MLVMNSSQPGNTNQTDPACPPIDLYRPFSSQVQGGGKDGERYKQVYNRAITAVCNQAINL